MGIQSVSPDVPSVSSSVHRYISDWLGIASVGPDCSEDVDRGRTQSPYQHLGVEGSSVIFGHLSGLDLGLNK